MLINKCLNQIVFFNLILNYLGLWVALTQMKITGLEKKHWKGTKGTLKNAIIFVVWRKLEMFTVKSMSV